MTCWSNVSLLVILLSLRMISFSRATTATSFCGIMDELDYHDSDCICDDHFDHLSHSTLGGMLTCSNTNPTRSSSQRKRATAHAVIHMGIHKTGSTSIQVLSRKFAAELQQDGYDMPWKVYQDHLPASVSKLLKSRENQIQFSSCFLQRDDIQRLKYPCVPELLISGSTIAKRKNNIFVSSEAFASISLDGLEGLSAYLSPWDNVTIVIYYRRYYEWLISDYNEKFKQRKLQDTGSSNMWNKSIVDFVTPQSTEAKDYYTFNLVKRVKEHFDNIVLMNFHEKNKELPEAFYCDAMPNAHHTCDAVRRQEKVEKDNGSVELIYQDLAYGAKQIGLISIDSQDGLLWVAASLKNYHEQEMNLTTRDFKMKCLSPETKENLLRISLEYEQVLMPETFASSLGEADLRSGFESKSQYELCGIDKEATLKEEHWQVFFKRLIIIRQTHMKSVQNK